MASKRQNTFQKNKTQETTENGIGGRRCALSSTVVQSYGKMLMLAPQIKAVQNRRGEGIVVKCRRGFLRVVGILGPGRTVGWWGTEADGSGGVSAIRFDGQSDGRRLSGPLSGSTWPSLTRSTFLGGGGCGSEPAEFSPVVLRPTLPLLVVASPPFFFLSMLNPPCDTIYDHDRGKTKGRAIVLSAISLRWRAKSCLAPRRQSEKSVRPDARGENLSRS
ncbi:hypothetical protein AAG570_012808 [Ranatra chinensis]|uniref:Uncharacterized protein n=1 Tax=Ranatra chinensis TaxID=642074 RepID=A0ABD0YFI1_9HEMI